MRAFRVGDYEAKTSAETGLIRRVQGDFERY